MPWPKLCCVVGASALAALPGCHAARPGEPVSTPAPQTRSLGPGGIRRTLIDRRPATDLDGWETRLYLIEYAPGAAAPPHAHPAVGVGLVLDGQFESAFGDAPLSRVRAGQGFIDQAAVPHRVFRNPSADRDLRFVIAYTLRAGDEPFHLLP